MIEANVIDSSLYEIGSLLEPLKSKGDIPLTSESANDETKSTFSWNAREERIKEVRQAGDVTIFKSVGVGIQDVAIAVAVVQRAEQIGIGTTVNLG